MRCIGRGWLLAALVAAGVGGPARAGGPARSWLNPLRYWDVARASVPTPRTPEAVEMAWTIFAKGMEMGPGDGWYHPAQTRYGWAWLAARYDADRDGVITRKEFRGPAELFDRLDRDHDGVITPQDLDWSNDSPQARMATMAFYLMDADANGRISRAEWEAFFKKASKGKGYVTRDDLREALTMPPEAPKNGPATDEPSRALLLAGLLRGEIGSLHEGPSLGERAPDFTLATNDGKGRIRLADVLRRGKPVVLLFGSFT